MTEERSLIPVRIARTPPPPRTLRGVLRERCDDYQPKEIDLLGPAPEPTRSYEIFMRGELYGGTWELSGPEGATDLDIGADAEEVRAALVTALALDEDDIHVLGWRGRWWVTIAVEHGEIEVSSGDLHAEEEEPVVIDEVPWHLLDRTVTAVVGHSLRGTRHEAYSLVRIELIGSVMSFTLLDGCIDLTVRTGVVGDELPLPVGGADTGTPAP